MEDLVTAPIVEAINFNAALIGLSIFICTAIIVVAMHRWLSKDD